MIWRSEGRGTRIETRRWTHRPARWLLPLAYAVAYAALFGLSSMYWFLPAGLRIAALWMSPRRDWWLLALADMGTIFALGELRGAFASPWTLLAASVVPWCVYAAIVRAFGRMPGAAPTPESMMRFLQCGIAAALANGCALTWINGLDDGAMPAQPIANLFTFALGDFIGIVLLAPLIRILLGQFRGHAVPWHTIFANGLVLSPLVVALGLAVLPVERVEFYPVVLSSFILFWLAYRYGWRAGAIALLLLSVGLYGFGDGLSRTWQPVQLQLLIAAAGFATLSLGMSADSLRTQGRALKASIEMLSTRTRALSDAANRIVSQQEEERRRIGAELHDQLGQDMTAIATRLRLIERATDAPHVRQGLRSIESLVATAHEHLRETIQSLHPLVLDRFGLARALAEGPMAELAREHGIDYDCEIEGPIDALPADIATAIYRICQEVTTNCVRHGCGGRMRIHLHLHRHPAASDLVLRIDDDAGGFDIATGNAGHGLQNIYDRADAIGAEYTFDPASGHPRHWLEVRVKAPA